MSVREKSTIEHFTRGSETFRHKAGMFWISILWVIGLSFAVALAAFWFSFMVFADDFQRSVYQYYTIARFESFIGLGGNRWLARVVDLADAATLGPLRPNQILELLRKSYAEHVAGRLVLFQLISVASFLLAAVAWTRFYFGFGKKAGADEFRRGAKLVEPTQLTEAIKKSKDGAGEWLIAGIPIPKNMEQRNILLTGSMGAGKSAEIFNLAKQVAESKKKMIIFDKSGELTEVFYRPGIDVILNPFDARYPGWNIHRELEFVYEFDQLAHSLIPNAENQSANSTYFTNGARIVFSSVLQKLWREGRRTTSELADVLLSFGPAEMAEYLADTPAAVYISPKSAEQAGGVLSTLVGAIEVLKHVPGGDFSIKEWVRRDDDCRLFIPSDESIHAVVLPLISMYLDIAIRAAMTREKTRESKVWVFLDELASLQALPVLKSSLVEGRKYGIVHVVGMQNLAQLRSVFGKDPATTLRANLQTQLVMRVTDEESAKAMAELLGKAEIDQQSEGLSFGAASSRDGSNVQTASTEKNVVIYSEIQNLPDLTGFLVIPGDYPVAKVTFKHPDLSRTQPGFVTRDELRLDQTPVVRAAPAVEAGPIEEVGGEDQAGAADKPTGEWL